MKNKIIIKCIIITAVIISITVFVILFLKHRLSEYEFQDKYSFSETADTLFEVSENEKNRITQMLQRKLTMDEQYVGFKKGASDTDLYYANSVIELAETLKAKEIIDMISNEADLINGLDIDSMSILNLIYYVNMCETIGTKYDKEDIYDCLNKYYDEKTNLFFLNENSDTINIKLVVTALCCNTLPEIIKDNRFNIIEGVEKAYENYEFNIDTTITLYNSGGDILYCMYTVGQISNEVLADNNAWFANWQEYYENIEIDSIEAALMYTEFYKIARIFDENYSAKKIQKYYDSLSVLDIETVEDLYIINNFLEFVDNLDNVEVNNHLYNRMKKLIDGGELYETDIDILETVYGVMLAKNTGFEVDRAKLQNYIDANYEAIDSKASTVDKVNYLYYTIILDQLNNSYSITCEADFLQGHINDAIKELKFKKDIYNDVILARKILEIVMDLQIHDVEVSINLNQVRKITKGIEKAAKSEKILNSVLITDIYIINKMLSIGVISEDTFIEKYRMLTVDGGSMAYSGKDNITEIYSTYRFYVCFERMSNYEFLEGQQDYVASLRKDDGIYAYSHDTEYISLESVLYGNSLDKVALGGNKF